MDFPQKLPPLRELIQEMDGGVRALTGIGPAVALFGGHAVRRTSPAYQLARQTAAALASSGFAILTGGGPGIMEAASRGAREGKGLSVGLNIRIPVQEIPNPYVDLSLSFRHFFTRKTIFVRKAAGFVLFPGGYGTLDELFEVLVLIQTMSIVPRPVILADKDYWAGLLDWLARTAVPMGTIKRRDLGLVRVSSDPQEIRAIILRAEARRTHRHPGRPRPSRPR